MKVIPAVSNFVLSPLKAIFAVVSGVLLMQTNNFIRKFSNLALYNLFANIAKLKFSRSKF
jgi:hypothetical protein